MRTTLPGTVQLRVIADEGDTERLAGVLRDALQNANYTVITTTVDVEDRFEPNRRKFHIIAVPDEELNNVKDRFVEAVSLGKKLQVIQQKR